MIGRTRKTKSKIFVTFVLAIAMLLSPLTTMINNMVVFAANSTNEITNMESEAIKITGFEEKVKFGEDYKLPKVDNEDFGIISNDDRYTYKVIQTLPYKILNSEDEEIFEKNGEYFFKAQSTANYVLEISKRVAGGGIINAIQNTYSGSTKKEGLTIRVISDSYSIVLPTNSKHIVPTKMPLLSGSEQLTLTIPSPTILNKDGEEISESEYTNLQVRVGDTVLTRKDDTYTFTPEELGTYQINYSYKIHDAQIERLIQEFDVVPASEFKIEDLKLGVEFASSIQERMTQGIETKLPNAYVLDQNKDRINGHIEITAKYITKNGEHIDVTNEIDQEKFTITPTKKGSYWIYYQAKHELFGLESTKVRPTTNIGEVQSEPIIQVVDEDAPTPLAVNKYETDEDGKIISIAGQPVEENKTEKEILDLLGDLSASVPNVVIIPNNETSVVLEDVLPAIYAKDNFSKGYNAFRLSRKVRVSGLGTTSDLYKLDDSEQVYENYEPASYEFKIDTTGSKTYSFIYNVEEVETGLQKSLTFTVTAIRQSDYEELTTKPKIEFKLDQEEIYDNDILVFDKPQAIDENTLVKDSNIDIDVVLKVIINEETKYFVNEELNYNEKTNKYEVSIKDLDIEGDITKISVIVYARNDYFNQTVLDFDPKDETFETDENIGRAIRTLDVLSSQDGIAPEITPFDGGLEKALFDFNEETIKTNHPEIDNFEKWEELYKENGFLDIEDNNESNKPKTPFLEGDTIALPTITVKDNNKNIKYSISIFNGSRRIYLNNSNPITHTIKEVDGMYELTLEGATFQAGLPGLYEVIFQFNDELGNLSVQTFGIRIGSNVVPTVVISSFPKTAELGEEFVYPGLPFSNGDFKYAKDCTISLSAPTGYSVENSSSRGFVPNVKGEYTIEYTWGKGENQSYRFRVNVADTIAPVINSMYEQLGHFAENDFKTIIDWPTMDDSDELEPTLIVRLPMYAVTDKNNNIDIDYAKVEVRRNNVKLTVQEDKANACYYFELKDHTKNQGVYTVEYFAEDNAGNKAVSRNYTLRIGNSHKPSVSFEKDAIPTTLDLNATWNLPLDKMTITDQDIKLGDTHEALMKLFKERSGSVRMIGPDNNEVKNIFDSGNGEWGWKFDQVGDYRLTLRVVDTANNEWTNTYTITIKGKDVKEDRDISNTVGTILIILSVAALSGVVIYFLFSNKRLANVEPQGTKKTSSKKEE